MIDKRENSEDLTGILDRILEILSLDGETHSTIEIASLTGINPRQVKKAFELLERIEFVKFDGVSATIDPAVKQLVLSNNEEERDGSAYVEKIQSLHFTIYFRCLTRS
jgi:DNA-binding transcriptional regulator YhcF (GntR family)